VINLSTVSFNIDIPTDPEGYFSIQCPYCENKFKVLGNYFENMEAIEIYCPICGLVNEVNAFFTNEVIEKAMSIAQNHAEELIYNMFKDLERKSRGNKFLKFKTGRKPSHHGPELYETVENFVIVNKMCCSSDIKVTALDKWLIPYCIKCGRK